MINLISKQLKTIEKYCIIQDIYNNWEDDKYVYKILIIILYNKFFKTILQNVQY